MIIDKDTIISNFNYKGTLLGAINNLSEILQKQPIFTIGDEVPFKPGTNDSVGDYYFSTLNGTLYQLTSLGTGIQWTWLPIYEFGGNKPGAV